MTAAAQKPAKANGRKRADTPPPDAGPQIVFRALDSLIPYARNARTHSPEQVAQLAASLVEFGFTNPVLADGTGIVAGHGRVLAARQVYDAGQSLRLPGGQQVPGGSIPVLDCTGWTEAQRRAYVLADNQLALNAGWDFDLLAVEIDDLRDEGFDLKLLGFDQQTLNDMIGTANAPPLPEGDADAIPSAPDVPSTRRGDIWQLGRHRIMCGDCRDAGDVAALLAGSAVNLAFTSPPYAAQREYDESSGFKPILPDEFVAWYEPVAANIKSHIARDGSYFCNIKPSAEGLDTSLYVFDLVIAHARQWGWHFATEFCWERNGVPKQVTQRFKNQFEPVYQFAIDRWKMRPHAVRHESDNVPIPFGKGAGDTSWKDAQGGNGSMFGGAKRRKNGTDKGMSDVQGTAAAPGEYIGPGLAYPGNRLPPMMSSHEALGHTAAFPVGLPEFFVKAYTDEGDAVFDPFMGSGSTLMAAERTARHGFGMELSPIYCDVIVARWQRFTGRQATLESTGQTFAEVSEQRQPATVES